MCSGDDDVAPEPVLFGAAQAVRRRRRLWEVQGGLQCSIVGTCFSHDDLLALARKSGHRIPACAAGYDVHSFFVREVGRAGVVARAMQKLLEQRYAVIVRKVGAGRTERELTALWEAESVAGRVPGAYWAYLSHTHIPPPLATRVFGEVHMLSHVLSRATRDSLNQVSALQARLDDLTAQLVRQAERHRQVVAERDAARASLADIKARADSRSERPVAPRVSSYDLASRIARKERALVATRERARSAEAQNARLGEQLARLKELVEAGAAHSARCTGAVACEEAVRSDIARRVLYIGGRTGAVDRLRQIAASVSAELLHHDGGEHESLSRIDGMIEGCDAVFCPMDCVSHSACLRAKALCRKLRKPFVPLRSSGASSFERALTSLTAIS